MPTRVGYVLLAASTLVLGGCDSDLVQMFYKGTTKAFAACMDQAKKQSTLSDSTAKAVCVEKHSVEIAAKLGGTAGYNRSFGSIWFTGNVINESKDTVVTSFSVVIMRKDKPEGEFRTFDNQWIEPGQSQGFSIHDLQYANDERLDISNGSFSWSAEMPKGLKVVF